MKHQVIAIAAVALMLGACGSTGIVKFEENHYMVIITGEKVSQYHRWESKPASPAESRPLRLLARRVRGKMSFLLHFPWCWFFFLWYSARKRWASKDAYCPKKGLPALQVWNGISDFSAFYGLRTQHDALYSGGLWRTEPHPASNGLTSAAGAEPFSASPRLKFAQNWSWYIFKLLVLVHFLAGDNKEWRSCDSP
jgi:hypothetical protein